MTDLDREQVRQVVAQVLPVLEAMEKLQTALETELASALGTDYKPEVKQVRATLFDLKSWCAPAGRAG